MKEKNVDAVEAVRKVACLISLTSGIKTTLSFYHRFCHAIVATSLIMWSSPFSLEFPSSVFFFFDALSDLSL